MCWFHYADGTFVIWPHTTEELGRFLDHLNAIHRNIQLKEMDGNLPFLTSTYAGDQMTPWAIRSTENQPTHLYLNHPSNLQALLSTLVHRARALCDKESLHDELEFPKTMFKENGYTTQIRHVLNSSIRTSMPVQKPTSVTVLPYVRMTYSSSTECSPNIISDVLPCLPPTKISSPRLVKEDLGVRTLGVYNIL